MLVKLVGERKTHPSHFCLPGELLAKNYYDSFLHLLQHKKIDLNFSKISHAKIKDLYVNNIVVSTC